MKRLAALLIAAAAVMAAEASLIAATWHITYGHGLFCVLGIASTVGCDAQPPGVAGRLAAVVVILTCIPLLGAVFAWLTGKHAAHHAAAKVKEHLGAVEKRIADEADKRHVIMQRHIERVVSGHCADVMHHVSVVADAQVSGGAGANPANQGFTADQPQADPAGTPAGERVVPPPATARKPSASPATRRSTPRRM
jgi:hypothetical protein